MIGDRYWATGIVVRYSDRHGGQWAASVNYLDNGFCDDDADRGVISTEGTLHTRYFVGNGERIDALTAVIDAVKADAERLGIEFRSATDGPNVFYQGDGEHDDWPPPDGWREMVDAQAIRIGWSAFYMQAMRVAEAPSGEDVAGE